MWTTIFTAIGVILLGILYYFDLLFNKAITREVFDQCMVIYREWQGDIDHVGKVFGEISSDLKPKLTSSKSPAFGIYFDDPKSLINKAQARCSIGYILITEEQKKDAQEIASTSNNKYKIASVPKAMTLSLEYKYRNMFSILLLGYFWRKIMAQFYSEGMKRKNDTSFVEVYDLREGRQSTIRLHYPLENIETFLITSVKKPESLDLKSKF